MSKQNFIIFSTADWDNPFWTNKQHTAAMLAKQGNRVLYIESLGLRQPTIKAQDLCRIFKRLLSFFKGTRKVSENLWVYSPLVIPLHKYKAIRMLNNFLLISIIRYFKWKLKLTNHISWTYNPIVLDLMESLKPSKKVYHSVDDLAAAPGLDHDLILREEKRLLAKVDVVFCTSKKIHEHCLKFKENNCFYFSNVVEFAHFSKAQSNLAEPQDLRDIPHPRLGFIGALSEYKVDLELLCNIAEKRNDWHWVLVGKIGEGQPGTRIESLENLENVHFLGPKKYEDLPNYLAHFDVCTIPTPINDYTNSMFPMKYYEFMAAGKPIVARNIDSLSENVKYHYSYKNEIEFILLVETALANGSPNFEAGQNLAKENTWEKRLEKMLKLIK